MIKSHDRQEVQRWAGKWILPYICYHRTTAVDMMVRFAGLEAQTLADQYVPREGERVEVNVIGGRDLGVGEEVDIRVAFMGPGANARAQAYYDHWAHETPERF